MTYKQDLLNEIKKEALKLAQETLEKLPRYKYRMRINNILLFLDRYLKELEKDDSNRQSDKGGRG